FLARRIRFHATTQESRRVYLHQRIATTAGFPYQPTGCPNPSPSPFHLNQDSCITRPHPLKKFIGSFHGGTVTHQGMHQVSAVMGGLKSRFTPNTMLSSHIPQAWFHREPPGIETTAGFITRSSWA